MQANSALALPTGSVRASNALPALHRWRALGLSQINACRRNRRTDAWTPRRSRERTAGPVAQRSEPAAHNRLMQVRVLPGPQDFDRSKLLPQTCHTQFFWLCAAARPQSLRRRPRSCPRRDEGEHGSVRHGPESDRPGRGSLFVQAMVGCVVRAGHWWRAVGLIHINAHWRGPLFLLMGRVCPGNRRRGVHMSRR
jgi:hypothetical protein